ncbi:MAG: hypothetical protein WC835_00150 [Candidatus Paceibacterota bacterium]|jgi:uncharacterized membrane protein
MKNKKFTIWEAIDFGWKSAEKNLWFLVGLFLLVFMLSSGTGWFPGSSFVISILGGISILTAVLDIYAGKKAAVENLFSKYNLILQYLVTSVLYLAMVFVGLVLFIIPGIYVMLRFQFYKFLIVDKEMEPIEALRGSAQMTRGHVWQLFGLLCISVALNILGLLALGVGLLVTVPVTLLAYTFVYKKLLAEEHHSTVAS